MQLEIKDVDFTYPAVNIIYFSTEQNLVEAEATISSHKGTLWNGNDDKTALGTFVLSSSLLYVSPILEVYFCFLLIILLLLLWL